MNWRRQKPILILLSISLVLNIALWLILIFLIKSSQDFPLILYYNIFDDTDILGKHHELYSLPIAGLTILIINILLGIFLKKEKENVLSYVLFSVALLSQVLLLIAGIALAVINA